MVSRSCTWSLLRNELTFGSSACVAAASAGSNAPIVPRASVAPTPSAVAPLRNVRRDNGAVTGWGGSFAVASMAVSGLGRANGARLWHRTARRARLWTLRGGARTLATTGRSLRTPTNRERKEFVHGHDRDDTRYASRPPRRRADGSGRRPPRRRHGALGPARRRARHAACKELGYAVEDFGDVRVKHPEQQEHGDSHLKYKGPILETCEELGHRGRAGARRRLPAGRARRRSLASPSARRPGSARSCARRTRRWASSGSTRTAT